MTPIGSPQHGGPPARSDTRGAAASGVGNSSRPARPGPGRGRSALDGRAPRTERRLTVAPAGPAACRHAPRRPGAIAPRGMTRVARPRRAGCAPGDRVEHRLDVRLGEAITRRISAVAVCCSRASVSSVLRASSSLKRRTFSIAMTAWSANVWRSAICSSVKGLTSTPTPIDADGPFGAWAPPGSCEARGPLAARAVRESRPVGSRVRHVNGPVSRMARPDPVPRSADRDVRRQAATRPRVTRRWRPRGSRVPVDRENGGGMRAAKRASFRDDVEDRPDVGRRLAITRRISAVEVCCSRASVRSAFRVWSSLSRRAFSIAIDAWSANVWKARARRA